VLVLFTTEVMFNMAVWQLEYFEIGAPLPYMRETFFRVDARDVAILRFIHMGGDDTLKVTSSKMVALSWLKKILRQE
jgi:hypothetical protein